MSKKSAANGDQNGSPEKEIEEEIPVKLHTTDSIYRGIILACLRTKQLIKGATPRTTAEFSHKRKNTRIAVEEIRQGLIFYEELPEEIV